MGLDEVGGAGGVFSDTSLVLGNGLLSDSTEFRTRLHLTGDPAQFSDEQLAQVLGGLPLGRTPEELAAEGFDSADAATLTVRVALPDGVDPDEYDVAGSTTGSVFTCRSSSVLRSNLPQIDAFLASDLGLRDGFLSTINGFVC